MFEKIKEKQAEAEAKERRDKEWNELQEKAKADLKTFEEQDERDREAAKTFEPRIKIEGRSHKFLCYDKVEVPCEFIESIKVVDPGAAPSLKFTGGYSYLSPGYNYAAQHDAVIEIAMLSGAKHQIICNRWSVDILFNALMETWRANR